MKLHGGTKSSYTNLYTSDDSDTENLIKTGDVIKISGTASNNGIYTVSKIRTDGTSLGSDGDVFYELKGSRLTNESSNSNVDLQIDVIRDTGDKLVALGDVDSEGGIDIWSTNATTAYGTEDNGWSAAAIKPTISGSDAKYIYHFVDEALRVCNINENNTSIIKWYGYIQRRQFDNNEGLLFAGWEEHSNILRPPAMGSNNYTSCYVNSPDVYDVTGTDKTQSFHDNSQATNYYVNNNGVLRQLKSADGTALLLDGAVGAGETDFVFDDGTDDTLDQNYAGQVITIGTNLGAEPTEYLFCIRESNDTNVLFQRAYGQQPYTAATETYSDNAQYILERGLGFNIGIDDGTGDGNWEAGTYEFYQSFVYEGNQESIPIPMGEGDSVGNMGAGLFTTVGAKALRVSIYADLAYNGRISGGRIYIRKQGSDDDLTLLVDIDISKGVRTNLNADHKAWSLQANTGYYVVGGAEGNCTSPNVDTYETINGFKPDVKFVSIGGKNEMYNSSVVTNRRAFIANVKIKGFSGELTRYGDRIMYSEIGKFDTFIEHNFIDVSRGDYGVYTAIESYADRLIAFKHNLIHIINISSPSPANWYLEETIRNSGVSYNYSVTKTRYGIAWLGEDGCYLYDGKSVKNLLNRKIPVSKSSLINSAHDIVWDEWYRGSDNKKNPMLGYDPISNSLVMMRSPDDNSDNTNTGWIYDFDSGGWSFSRAIFTDSEHHTNFVTDWNNNLVVGINVTGDTADVNFKKFLPIPVAKSSQKLYTRDIDFGQPGLIKKIYKVMVTYKCNGSSSNPFRYAIDGKQNFSGDGGGAFTGSLVDTSNQWDVVTLTPSSTISCQSIQIGIEPGNHIVEINDMTVEYRVIPNKRVS